MGCAGVQEEGLKQQLGLWWDSRGVAAYQACKYFNKQHDQAFVYYNIRTVLDAECHVTFRNILFLSYPYLFVQESFHITVTSSLLQIGFLNLLKLFSVNI